MYLVVSRWEPIPGKEKEFEERGRIVRNILKAQPEVKLIQGFRTEDGAAVAVHAYESREAYDRIINDANGPFAKAVAAHGIEDCARWVRSERGDTVDDD